MELEGPLYLQCYVEYTCIAFTVLQLSEAVYNIQNCQCLRKEGISLYTKAMQHSIRHNDNLLQPVSQRSEYITSYITVTGRRS